MISLKIKTLDSQDHDFSVEDDVTVRQFKEIIAAKTNIAVDMQRLIYCGRVLNDEKPLREYDVNGKVVHLVERAPPRTRTTADGSSGSNRRNNDNPETQRASHRYRTLAIPIATQGSTQNVTTSMNPSSTLCMNRISVARHMLECANNIVNYLENPERGLNNSQFDILGQPTMESTVFEVGISAVTDGDVPQHEVQNIVQAFQGAVSAALRQNGMTSIEISPSGVNRIPTVVIGRRPQNAGDQPNTNSTTNANEAQQQTFGNSVSAAAMSAAASVAAAAASVAASATAAASAASADAASSETTNNAASGSQASSNSASATSSPSISRNQTTSPRVLAEVVNQMRTLQTRMEPFMQQYYDILQNEPTFTENDTTARDSAQRVFDRVSEALHYLSHAQHAISDLMLDLSQPIPRHLCCRPILVEQSAFVSSGFNVPNMIPVSARVRADTGNNNESTQANNNTNGSAFIEIQDPIVQVNVPADGSNATASPNNSQLHVARLIQAVVNSVPMYEDVHLEISRSNEQGANGDSATTTTNNSSTNTSPTAAANDGGAAGENEQPRVTTATHPTTSTQTRSTARPQVHVTSLPAGQVRNFHPNPLSMPLSSFDRFLPCNSHHIRGNQERNANNQTQQMMREVRRRNPLRRATVHLGERSQSAQRASRSTEQPDAAEDAFIMFTNDEFRTPVRIFGAELSIRDLVGIAPQPSSLNRIRSDLHAYAVRTFGSPISETNLQAIYDKITEFLTRSVLGQGQIESSIYNVIHSVNKLIHHTLPNVVNLILEDDSSDFGMRLLRCSIEFVRRLMSIVSMSVGPRNAERFLNELTTVLIREENAETPPITVFKRHLNLAIRRQLDMQIIDRSDIQEFLVIRLPAPDLTVGTEGVVPMETDDADGIANANNQIVDDEVLPSIAPLRTPLPEPMATNQEALPQVTVGSELWHAGLPQTWLPVITRDISRQRRTIPPPPYSDAYLSGMSSKRRKLITNNKTSDPRTFLAEGVRKVMQSRAGGNNAHQSHTSNVSAEEALASNPHICEPHGSYEQAIRTFVQNRISSDPDYSPERFPNCSKWVNKQK